MYVIIQGVQLRMVHGTIGNSSNKKDPIGLNMLKQDVNCFRNNAYWK